MTLEVGQAKTRRTDLDKFTLVPVRGGQFQYKSIEQVTNTTLIATNKPPPAEAEDLALGLCKMAATWHCLAVD